MPPGYKTIISVETSPIGAHRTVLAALDGLPADMPGAPKSARAAPRGARTGTDGRALAPARYLTRGSPGSGRPVRNTREVGPGLGGSPGGRAVEVDWASRGGPRWRNSRVRRVDMVPGPRWRARGRRRRRRWRRHRATGSGVSSRAPNPKRNVPGATLTSAMAIGTICVTRALAPRAWTVWISPFSSPRRAEITSSLLPDARSATN